MPDRSGTIPSHVRPVQRFLPAKAIARIFGAVHPR